MKKTKITCLTLATVMMASSCTSSYQAAGGMTGAMIGSSVGEAVGFLSGHGPFRGENAALGSLIGMGIGAVLGVGIASQIEENEKVEARRYEERNNDSYGYQTVRMPQTAITATKTIRLAAVPTMEQALLPMSASPT